jgi:exosortase A-associated hydrolase 2
VAAVEAFFLGAGAARRFAVCWRPPAAEAPRGALLFVPPFAEEMNKSRRMVALTADALAAQGFVTLRIDLAGCGDSAGVFGQASWDVWLDDLATAWRWLRAQGPAVPWLWSLRAGALLGNSLLPRLDASPGLLLWQPVLAGKQHLTQFLRLRVAADAFALADASARATTQGLLQSLASGAAVGVAGYTLPPSIALSLAATELGAPPAPTDVHWLEVDSGQTPTIAPASAARIAQWQAAGQRVVARAVGGPAFWATQEIEDCPALLDATLEALCPPN